MATVRKKGRNFEVRWYYFDRIDLKRKQGTKAGFFTEKEASEFGKRMEVLDRQNKLFFNSYTVSDYLRNWLKNKSRRVSVKSAENYKNAIENHIIPEFEKTKLTDLKKNKVSRIHIRQT
ncbi:yrhd [Listeria grandensis FSL F6-0971]|uniref:Yrhd n=1 Tax=Listeria grandensis FSL F6-0971 TaxID=1265819 RepID=W7BRT4_9LIST|nr:N-terminal phage integrase SAM-like domain-containing protein [Listeria grandensis]EUJ22963.1 yrhd [Listeria grandensis FSL F6-0971]